MVSRLYLSCYICGVDRVFFSFVLFDSVGGFGWVVEGDLIGLEEDFLMEFDELFCVTVGSLEL